MVALAIAVMIGDGCCAFVSISLGRNEIHKAKRSVGNAVVMCLVSSILLTALYLIFADTILAMFGGTVNAETYHHSQEYFFYITLGVPFYMFGQAMNPIIRADGSPRFAMISTLAGAVLNIILDPIFILGFHWGMMGAAVATVIGQVVTAVLAVWYLLHAKIIRPEKGDYRLKGSICGRTLTLGMTSFLSQISLVAAMAAINNMIRKYGALDSIFGQEQYAQIPMAVVGIVMKFFQIVISIVVGMAAGRIPIVGFNMGAKKSARVKELFSKLLLAEAAVGAVALVLVEVFPRQLIALFGAANESVYYTDFAVRSFRIYLCMIVLACVNKACFIFLQVPASHGQSGRIHHPCNFRYTILLIRFWTHSGLERAGACRGGAPPSCWRKTALPLKSPTGAFIAAQPRHSHFRRKRKIRTLLLSRKGSDFHCLVRIRGLEPPPSCPD